MKFREATDAETKKYLASRLFHAQTDNERLTETNTELYEKLQLSQTNSEKVNSSCLRIVS